MTLISANEYNIMFEDFYSSKTRALGSRGTSGSSSGSESVFEQTAAESNYYGYESVDDADDGKIDFWQKAKCVVNGFGKSLWGMVTGAFKNPLKTLAMVGLCCIPVVGPVAMGFFAAKGLIGGVNQIVQAASMASTADSDAEAMYAWENIGSGVFQTAGSIAGLKGAGSLLKSQFTGGSMAVNAIKSGQSTVGEVAKLAIKDTAGNIGQVVNGVKNKITKISNGIKNTYKGLKSDGLSYLSDKFTQFKDWGRTKIDNFANKVQEKIDNFGKDSNGKSLLERVKDRFSRAGKEARAQRNEAAADKLKELEGGAPGVKRVGSKYEQTTVENGVETTSTYNAKGRLVEERIVQRVEEGGITYDRTTVVSYRSNGSISRQAVTDVPVDCVSGMKMETVDSYGRLGSHKTEKITTTTNSDGTQLVDVASQKQTTFGNTINRTSRSIRDANGRNSVEISSSYDNMRTGVRKVELTDVDGTKMEIRGNSNDNVLYVQRPKGSITPNDTTQALRPVTYKIEDLSSLNSIQRIEMLGRTTNIGARVNNFIGPSRAFNNNPFYSFYSWYEATEDEDQ